jgi:hypothetical protein
LKEVVGVEIEQIMPSDDDALGVGNMPWSFCIYLAHYVGNPTCTLQVTCPFAIPIPFMHY